MKYNLASTFQRKSNFVTFKVEKGTWSTNAVLQFFGDADVNAAKALIGGELDNQTLKLKLEFDYEDFDIQLCKFILTCLYNLGYDDLSNDSSRESFDFVGIPESPLDLQDASFTLISLSMKESSDRYYFSHQTFGESTENFKDLTTYLGVTNSINYVPTRVHNTTSIILLATMVEEVFCFETNYVGILKDTIDYNSIDSLKTKEEFTIALSDDTVNIYFDGTKNDELLEELNDIKGLNLETYAPWSYKVKVDPSQFYVLDVYKSIVEAYSSEGWVIVKDCERDAAFDFRRDGSLPEVATVEHALAASRNYTAPEPVGLSEAFAGMFGVLGGILGVETDIEPEPQESKDLLDSDNQDETSIEVESVEII